MLDETSMILSYTYQNKINMSERIEIQTQSEGKRWEPFIGEELSELLRSKGFSNNSGLSQEGLKIQEETYRIMQACGDPAQSSHRDTGIVIGYVQSGKTLSFTALTALARDNGYRIVIIIAGISKPLLEQSTRRVRKDIRIDARYGYEQKWIQLTNPSTNDDLKSIENVLDQWNNPTFPKERCKTILITVMKNASHLKNLEEVMSKIDLKSVPTLIIDDEGDQASLNTKARRASRLGLDIENLTEADISTIYRRIVHLCARFPHHTFLQYTATPQANLFINIMDRLSPNFIKLLTPGADYTGGIDFFRNNRQLLSAIPETELSSDQHIEEPPNTLFAALKVFYLGVVSGTILQEFKIAGQHNRSMLIHPSRLQEDHSTFYSWVNAIKQSWTRLLSGGDDEEKTSLLAEFRSAYDDLSKTVANLPSFESLSGDELIHAIQYTPIVEVNSRNGSTPQINWQEWYSWILVGGQSMDRGFTVEGLTITYMPRNVGMATVDTIQQRARFFGYKRGYLGYCRVFLDQVTIDSYSYTVEHEEDVRNRLMEYDIGNQDLNRWNREAVLNQMLNITRTNILYDRTERDHFGEEWLRIRAPHDTEELIASNRKALFSYLNPRISSFEIDKGHPDRTAEQKHLTARVKIKDCLEELLNELRFTRESDSATYASLRGLIKRHQEKNSDEECLIYLMSTTDINNWTPRIRSLEKKNNELQQLFQGRNAHKGTIIYPGDAAIKEDDLLTVQIHFLNLKDTSYVEVPSVAIWVPEHIGKDIIRLI